MTHPIYDSAFLPELQRRHGLGGVRHFEATQISNGENLRMNPDQFISHSLLDPELETAVISLHGQS